MTVAVIIARAKARVELVEFGIQIQKSVYEHQFLDTNALVKGLDSVTSPETQS